MGQYRRGGLPILILTGFGSLLAIAGSTVWKPLSYIFSIGSGHKVYMFFRWHSKREFCNSVVSRNRKIPLGDNIHPDYDLGSSKLPFCNA